MVTYHPVPEERVGLEFDEFLCLLYPGVSKGFIRRAIREGDIEIVGKKPQETKRLRMQDVIAVHLEESEFPKRVKGAPTQIEVLFEDDSVMVINKPAGIAVEPERWDKEAPCITGMLLDWAAAQAAEGAEPIRPRLVHRIDKDTSGALLVAKNLEAERELRRGFEGKTIEKRYLALVEGEFPAQDGESIAIEHAIAHEPRKEGRMKVVETKGRASHTDVWTEQRFRGYTLVRCAPRTGRTHQIRVHLAFEGFPLAVDTFYGRRDALLLSDIKSKYRPKSGAPERPLMPRLTLHAHSISWPRPGSGGQIMDSAEAPLPKDFERTLKQMAKARPYTPPRY
ncbi:MAG: 23S rRNA pseudouridine1911/1915/1917 synthase [Planctomycetota bacterium]|jgi:23S rRNA pseudouridine1911/1915/1917 synthase